MKKILAAILIAYSLYFKSQNFPIVGYIGVPAEFATKKNFLVMKNAGFNISLSTFSNFKEAIKTLDAAQAAGMKIILFFPQIHTDPQAVFPQLKNHPAFFGYFIGDEPSPSEFENFRKYIDIVKAFDNTHMFYVNLHPIYAPKINLQNLSYSDYLSKAVAEIPFSVVSFDHYAFEDNKLRDNFYQNLQDVKIISDIYNKKFWGFACSTIHNQYLQPTLAQIKIQQFGNLLYGAQGLQYFTYWTNISDPNWKKENYSYGIVDDKGNPTITYNIVKEVNDQIQNLSWIFSSSKINYVHHYSSNARSYNKNFVTDVPEGFVSLKTQGDLLISHLQSENSQFTIIQNKSSSSSVSLDYELLRGSNVINSYSGKIDNLATKKRKTVIPPGDIFIVKY